MIHDSLKQVSQIWLYINIKVCWQSADCQHSKVLFIFEYISSRPIVLPGVGPMGICRRVLHGMGLYWKQPDWRNQNKCDMDDHSSQIQKSFILKRKHRLPNVLGPWSTANTSSASTGKNYTFPIDEKGRQATTSCTETKDLRKMSCKGLKSNLYSRLASVEINW